MEILFRDEIRVYQIIDDTLDWSFLTSLHILSNIPHLKDAEVLYHYKDLYGDMYPVYYEHGINFISRLSGNINYLILDSTKLVKDYTIVNLNLI